MSKMRPQSHGAKVWKPLMAIAALPAALLSVVCDRLITNRSRGAVPDQAIRTYRGAWGPAVARGPVPRMHSV